jgi:hypothetical protein
MGSQNVTDPNNNNAEINNFLYGVSCPSTSFCAAVGYDEPQSAESTLIEQPGADGWTIVSSTNGGSNVNELLGVSCVGSSAASSFCAAVGTQDSPPATLVEHWNGSAWGAPVMSPDPGTTDNQFHAVTCLSSSFCAAAGFQRSTAGSNLTLIAEYDGTAWTADSTPNQNPDGNDNNALFGASCVSTNIFCVAAGSYGVPTDPTLILQAFIPGPTPTAGAAPASVPVPAAGAQGGGSGWVAAVCLVLGMGLLVTTAGVARARRRLR